MKCKNCGSKIKASDKFCGTCGTQNELFGSLEEIIKTRKINKKLIWIVICVVIVLGGIGAISVSMNEKDTGNGIVKNEEADFGITLDEYIANVEREGISIEYGGAKTLDDGTVYHTYYNGERQLWIYTLPNGNVCQVAFISPEYEYGVNQIGTMIINLAARLFAATGVSESSDSLYSAIYKCILEGGGEATLQLGDCVVYYSRIILEHNEVAWITAN